MRKFEFLRKIFENTDSKHRFYGLVFSLVGSLGVFAFIVSLNNFVVGLDRNNSSQTAVFQVEKIEKPKTQAQNVPPKPKKNQTPRLQPPNLSSNLAGLSFGLSQFEIDMTGMNSILGDMQDMIMTSDTVDIPPRAQARPPLHYPAQARSKGITGYVRINLLIGVDGRIEQVKLLESEPQGVFDQVAMHSIKAWKFAPAEYQGKQVRVWAQQTIRFDLN